MVLPDYVEEMARYNAWQNQVIYELSDGIGDDERKRDRGMFFRCIHDTLDHILLIDRLILRYLDQGSPPPMVLQRQFEDFAELRAARNEFDENLTRRAAIMTADWIAEPMQFWSDRLGRERSLPRGFMLTQMFNHQTHHRSQVTAELHKMGVDYGSTDLPFNPHSAF